MTNAVLASCSPGEIRVAVTHGGVLVDYALWRPGLSDGVGDVHVGRVSAVLPAMAGAFVALHASDGFLPDSAGAAGLTQGDAVLVRIVRAAQGGKGPRLAVLPGEAALPIRRIAPGPGAVERLAAVHPGLPVIVDDPAVAACLRPVLGLRLRIGLAFDDAAESEIAALATPEVMLPGGLAASIHPTPALVAIDIDTAGASSARQEKKRVQSTLNQAALPEIARQIRLRNLSGAILVDLAGMALRRRAALGPAFAAALANDPLKPRFLGFTGLGFAEISRPSVHPPLYELLAGPHAAGLAALRQAVRDFDPARARLLRAAPGVIAALEADPVALPALAHRFGRPLMLRSDPQLAACTWRMEESPNG